MSIASIANAATTGTGSSLNLLSCVYNPVLPTLTAGQVATVQCDQNGKFIPAPSSLIFGSPFLTTPAIGIGSDTAFPTTVLAVGTTLGALPTGASRVLVHIPPGSSVSLYVATTIAASASDAAAISVTYANPSGNASNLDVPIDLNGLQQVFLTNYTSGTGSVYISGKPVFRFI